MVTFGRQSPGPCPICGAAHTACTAMGPAGVVIDQLPARTALARETPPDAPLETVVEFTTGTYERKKHRLPK